MPAVSFTSLLTKTIIKPIEAGNNMDKEILEKLRELNEDDDKERLPDRELTVRALKLLQTLLFPDYFHFCSLTDPLTIPAEFAADISEFLAIISSDT